MKAGQLQEMIEYYDSHHVIPDSQGSMVRLLTAFMCCYTQDIMVVINRVIGWLLGIGIISNIIITILHHGCNNPMIYALLSCIGIISSTICIIAIILLLIYRRFVIKYIKKYAISSLAMLYHSNKVNNTNEESIDMYNELLYTYETMLDKFWYN